MNTKKILMLSILFTTAIVQAIPMEGFDYETLRPYIERAQQTLQATHDALQLEDHGSREIIWTGRAFAEKLYPKQKKALKVIKKELKANAHALKDGNPHSYITACQIYKAFKKTVYKPWKKASKEKYELTKSNQNADWSWVHTQKISVQN